MLLMYIGINCFKMEDNDCPICYDKLTDVNVCITICKHKFHTNCLMRCNNTCPICRTHISSTTRMMASISPGKYTFKEFVQQMSRCNMQIDDVTPETREWIENCRQFYDIFGEMESKVREMEEQNKQMNEEEHKNMLKKTDINKYNLLYGRNKSSKKNK